MPSQSHTMRVNFLRRFFPILAGIVFAFVVSWPIMNELRLNYKSKHSETRLKVEEIALTMPAAGQPMQLQIKTGIYRQGCQWPSLCRRRQKWCRTV